MKKLIIGNWKMNPQTLKEAKKIVEPIKRIARKNNKVKIVLCVPFVFIEPLSKYIGVSPISIGAQNTFWEEEGAYTGEISPAMLKKLKVSYCLVGHSERRKLGETAKVISKKARACLSFGITPIICVGETERDNEGMYLDSLGKDLLSSIEGISFSDLKKIIIAYEPVWAISTSKNRPAKPEESEEMSIFFKKVLHDYFKKDVSNIVTIIYGGSSNSDNTSQFLINGGVSGLLPGTASLNPHTFCEMIKIAQSL